MTIFTAVGVCDRAREIAQAFPLSAGYVRAAAGKTNKTSAEQSVSGIYALLLLLERAGEDPGEIALARKAGGKPYIVGSRLHFSVAHSSSLAVCALSDSPVGIDTELVRGMRDAVSLSERFFTRAEAGSVAAAQDPSREFLRIWTRKEALIKRLGEGVDGDLAAFDTTGHDFSAFTLRFGGGEYLTAVTGAAEYIRTEVPSVIRE